MIKHLKKLKIGGSILAVFLVLFSIFYFLASNGAFAFVGPSSSPPSGSGAIAVDSSNNISVGTTTVSATTKLLITGATNDSTKYGLRATNLSGTTIFSVRNDGLLILGSLSSAPSGVNGAMYYDTGTNKFKCYENGSWSDCVGGGGTLSGSGTNNTIAKWTGSNTLGDSYITQAGNSVIIAGAGLAIGTTTAQAAGWIYVAGNMTVGGNITTLGNFTVTGNLASLNNMTVSGNLTVLGNFTGNVPATSVTSGYFQGGDYRFPAKLRVGTSSTAPTYTLDVTGDINITGAYRKGGVSGLTVTCASGQTVASTTVSGGIITNGTCVAVGGAGGVGGSGTSSTIPVWTTGGATLTNSIVVQTNGTTVTVGGGTGKINVGTVDPIYTINGKKYATYMAGMTGVKEETAGVIRLQRGTTLMSVPNDAEYGYVIDFKNIEEGSDLWLFSKTTNLKENFDKMVVLLTPSFDGRVWYEKDLTHHTITIYAKPYTLDPEISPEISYRLTAPRFDAESWSNYSFDESGGFIIND
jgi:hypothetical protein